MDQIANFRISAKSSEALKAKGGDKKVLAIRLVKEVASNDSDEEEPMEQTPSEAPPGASLKQYPEDDAVAAGWWRLVQEAILAVQEARPTASGMSQEHLLRCVSSFMEHKSPQAMYARLTELTRRYIKKKLDYLLDADPDRLFFLKEVNTCWTHYCELMKQICNVFLPLDRGYVLQNSHVLSIWDMGLDMFRTHIMCSPLVKTRAVDGLLLLIERERAGESIDRSLVKSLIGMLLSLQLYSSVFQPQFLEKSAQLYSDEGTRKVAELTVPEYLQLVTQRLQQEEARLLHYLQSCSTRPLLLHLVVKQLLGEHVTTIITKGLDDMLRQNRKKDMKLLYSLIGRVKDGHVTLCQYFTSYIKTHGRTLVAEGQDAEMVQQLLTFKDQMDAVVQECCHGNERFGHGVKEAFEAFINTRANRPAELIAKYIDNKLRAGNKEATEDELERILDKIMVLFRFINGKDVFEAFYKKDLAKRLLLGKSASVDAEKSMLSKLKAECGAGFTNKLEGMFRDMELSKDLMLAFRQHLQTASLNTSIELTVSVLTHGFWPSYGEGEVLLPDDMLRLKVVFTEYYGGKHSGRKLMWQNSLGHCVVRAGFPAGVKELQVSLHQALVLLRFNAADTLSVQALQRETGIEDAALRRTLQSLACGKVRVLTKTPRGREVAADDVFAYNADFANPLFRIRINQIQLKETTEERQKTEEQVFQDRQYQIDAAVVRLMKTRKTLTHTDLIDQLFHQLVRFPVQVNDIKKRIESLIERDYMERDKDNPNTYSYIA